MKRVHPKVVFNKMVSLIRKTLAASFSCLVGKIKTYSALL